MKLTHITPFCTRPSSAYARAVGYLYHKSYSLSFFLSLFLSFSLRVLFDHVDTLTTFIELVYNFQCGKSVVRAQYRHGSFV